MRNLSVPAALVLVCIATAATVFVAAALFPRVSPALNSALLAATLVAVVAYTVEAHRLRAQQRAEAEVREHPWLKISRVSATKTIHADGVLGGYLISFVIENVGMTPANGIAVTTTWTLKGEEVHEGTDATRGVHLAPGDEVGHIITADLDEPGNFELLVDATYETISGGSGHVRAYFGIDGPDRVRRLGSSYDWSTSDE